MQKRRIVPCRPVPRKAQSSGRTTDKLRQGLFWRALLSLQPCCRLPTSFNDAILYYTQSPNSALDFNFKQRRMATNICECHCGTRIDLDEQLLEERQMWKQKYLCLQKQVKIDIQTLKDNIYAECADIMQQQFSQKQQEHNKFVNQKNVEVKDLIARIINLETQVKVLSKEKELLEQKIRQVQAQINQKDQIIGNLKSKSSKTLRDWELKHEEQIANIKQRLTSQSKQGIDKLQAEREILQQKLKQFECKYQKIIPQVEKIKNALNQKTAQNQQLLNTIQKLKKKQEDDTVTHGNKYEDLTKIHSTCGKHIKQLSQKNDDLERQLQKCKKINRDVRVEPVYIDRPVQVERVVQKIVQVQKLVNKYVNNPQNDKKMRILEEDNRKLKDQLNNVLKQIKEVEDHFHRAVSDYDLAIKQHQKNADLYKKERESLAFKISQQNKELQLLNNFIEKIGSQRVSRNNQNDGQKIVIHVKQDGTYQKTVQKMSAVASTNQRRKK